MRLKEVAISLTDKCNAQCMMCGIWKKDKKEEFDICFLRDFPREIRNIVLTGGEPFLYKDILSVVEKLKFSYPYARIVITTNGILTGIILKNIKEILRIEPKIAVRISLDGIGDIHDRIRGVYGAYRNVLETIIRLKALEVKDLGLSFVILNENLDQLHPVYNFAKRMRINFNCQIVHSSDFYFQIENKRIKDKALLAKELNSLISSELKTFSVYKLFKTYYYKGIFDYLNNKQRKHNCHAGSLFCYINTKAEVYPCIMLKEKMGDLKENSFKDIWESKTANLVREKVKNCNKNCYLICTIAPTIKNNPFKALPWIIKNKIKAHLGIGVLGE